MTFDPKQYHPDWKNISRQIREQAGNVCEFCAAPNGKTVIRCRRQPERWSVVDGMEAEASYLEGDWVTMIVLTVAHLNHDKADNDPSNLRALCQRCHLLWDIDHHVRNAADTRRRKRIEAGQAVLL